MKIAVTGYEGRLGSELVRNFGCIPFQCDITKPEEIEFAAQSVSPDIIINCAAITSVDYCETEEGFNKALLVNFHGVENLQKLPIPLIHISTDYVFGGNRGPYSEKQDYDDVSVNNYGISKLGGEVVLLYPSSESIPRIIVRTTGLFCNSEHHDFVKQIVSHLSDGKPIKVARDLYGNQTYVPFLAERLVRLADKIGGVFEKHKIIHIASSDVITRYDFALMIANHFGFDTNLIIPASSKEIEGWIARRPKFGGLKTSLMKRLGLGKFSILDGLKELK